MTDPVVIRPGENGWTGNTYTWDNFSWNRIVFESAEVWGKDNNIPPPATITIWGREQDGRIDTTNSIVAEFQYGSHVKLTVKVDGLIVKEETQSWSMNMTDTFGPYSRAWKVSISPTGNIYTEIYAGNWGSWTTIHTFYSNQMAFQFPYGNTIPSVTTSNPANVDRFQFTEFSLGSAPSNPVDLGDPNPPMDVKNFEMTPTYWKSFNPNNPELPDWYYFRMEGQLAHFEFHHMGPDWFWKQPLRIPERSGFTWEITYPYEGPGWEIQFTNNVDMIAVSCGFTTAYNQPRVSIYGQGSAESSITVPGTSGEGWGTALRYFRVFRLENKLKFQVRVGDKWTTVLVGPEMTNPDAEDFNLAFEFGGYVDIHRVEGIQMAPGDDGEVVTQDPDNDIPDTYTPYVPPDADAKTKTCTSLLDLIREFSAAIKRPVRIINASTIEVVSTTETIPPGWRNGFAGRYYTNTTQNLEANTTVLAQNKGTLTLSGRAKIRTNDIGIVTTKWRIPQRLPFPGLKNAPVSRVSYSMTPKAFNAEVEFQFPSVPVSVKRV